MSTVMASHSREAVKMKEEILSASWCVLEKGLSDDEEAS